MHMKKYPSLITSAIILFLVILSPVVEKTAWAQFSNKWMAVGSLHNWYTESGCEIEHGNKAVQQNGLQWPAIYEYQDSQAAKGFWIGAANFTDENDNFFDHKVVHVGPRVNGEGEFLPQLFQTVSKFEPPAVFVDGVLSFDEQVDNDEIDPNLAADRMIINVCNTQLGLTVTRKIFQFGQQYHDNYMIYEYTFTNTGNTDNDASIELPDNTLTDICFFYQYRYASCFQTRYIVGNATGWGLNTMHDARGDGTENPVLYNDPVDENFRAQFAWHGYYPDKLVSYDNIGGPIWAPDLYGYNVEADTIGRIGAPQFVGILTIHADASPDDRNNDPAQPSTTGYWGSNDILNSNNSAFDRVRMDAEYSWMVSGHKTPRHAWVVEPSGNFAIQKNAPGFDGAGAGFSIGNGYGPYTLQSAASVTIVMAEAVAGLNRDKCIEIGRRYKRNEIDAVTKNQLVLTGKDSLFQTFRRAIQNYESGYTIPEPPKPPKLFNVAGGGDRINLSWEVYEDDPNLTGFRIYRMTGIYNDPIIKPELIYEAGRYERGYADLTPVRGVAYYYYIVSVGQSGIGELVSSRYYTQTYDPTFLTRPAGTSVDQIRVVPNPYIISSDEKRLRFPNEPDKLAFFNIPGQCKIEIFSENGELINTLQHTNGSGDEYWNCVTSSNQVVVSGIYIAVITNLNSGEQKIVKFVVIR